jgi:acyl transferase domain-containing protein
MPTSDREDGSDGAPSPPRRVRDIAIVGMACVMPGAGDVEAFWANIVDGVDSVVEVPPSRWDTAVHFDADHDPARRHPGAEPKAVSRWGGFVPDVGFDALRWGIPPASLASIDPAQLMSLIVAAGALDDAGYGDAGRAFDRDRASVVIATGSGGAADLPAGFLLRLLLRTHGVPHDGLPPDLDAFLPRLTEDGLPGVLTSVIAGRVANRLDLGGKNLTVDSACASVLVGLDIACNELSARSSDLVLLGAVDLHNGPQDYVSFSAAQALSRTGRCRSFDADADGMTLAEGAGCLVLKRLADAERDGDRVYAVIRGVAGSSDGRHLGLTAPRQEGQVKAVRRTYAEAGMSPSEVGLVEAHGTGTPTGDRIELGTTTEVFAEAGAPPGSVVLGSVKSNIGHIKCAAGIASLIKAARAVHHGVQPPTLHIDRPNPAWDPATSPFVFLDRARPWLDERRVAAVSGFGFGGTNFHAVLENHRGAAGAGPAAGGEPGIAPGPGRVQWPAELVVVRAADDAELAGRLGELAARLEDELSPPVPADRVRLRDVAAAVSSGGDGPVRLAIVARDPADLAAKVAAARRREAPAGVHRAPAWAAPTGPQPDAGGPAVAFLVPDEEAARPGMAADLLVAFPRLRGAAPADPWLVDVLWPPQTFGDDEHTIPPDVAGPSVALAAAAVSGVLNAVGVRADHVLGPGGRAGRHELADELRRLHAGGVRAFVEVGPEQGLAALAVEALGDRPHVAVATDRQGQHGLVTLVDALARLAVAGVPVDVAGLHAGRGSQPHRWQAPARRAGWIVNGHFVRTASGDPLPNGLRPASEAPPIRLAAHDDAGVGAGPGVRAAPVDGAADRAASRDVAVVAEYLRILDGVLGTGADIARASVPAGEG